MKSEHGQPRLGLVDLGRRNPIANIDLIEEFDCILVGHVELSFILGHETKSVFFFL